MASPPTRGHLVVVSNRLPVRVRARRGQAKLERSPGGLVAALDPVLRERGGTWVGWPGGPLPAAAELERNERESGYRLVPVPLSASDLRRYYHGFSNRTLWPLLHSFPTRMELDREEWAGYEDVNRRFARRRRAPWRTPATCSGSTTISCCAWRRICVASAPTRASPSSCTCRSRRTTCSASCPGIARCCAGLLACDLVGFHCARLRGELPRLRGAAARRARRSRARGRSSTASAPSRSGPFRSASTTIATPSAASRGAAAGVGQTSSIVLGVDRLDYTKGLPEKIRAFERFLELHPEHHERVVLLQIAEPTRDEVPEYQRLKRQVDELVGDVNGRFATSRWTPIRYLHRSVAPDELAGLYRDAEVALVTPLRDGMNLVAKEYVASPGRRARACSCCRGSPARPRRCSEALRVNPYNVDAVADRAAPGARRWTSSERTRAHARAPAARAPRTTCTRGSPTSCGTRAPLARIRPLAARGLRALARRPSSRAITLALFLDYDGTLAPIARHPSEARLRAGDARGARSPARRAPTPRSRS